jgi:hypothetical protein
VSVASGVPLFGQDDFCVCKTGRVLVISGEGSSRLVRRRIAKLSEAHGVDFDVVAHNVIVTDDTARVTSDDLSESVQAAVIQHDPVLVVLDPLYTFMPSGEADQAGNLFKMGPLYAKAREVVGDRALITVTHFNKAGRDTLELSSITQAGGREFAPSWWLIRHSRDADVNEQSFGLEVRPAAVRGSATTSVWTSDCPS